MVRPKGQFEALIEEVNAGRLDRRAFMKRASAIGLSASAIGLALRTVPALGQDAGTGGVIQSITREEYAAQLREQYQFAENPTKGGQVILGDSTDISGVNAMLMGDSPTNDVFLGPVFETLVGGSVITGEPVPGLADSWEIAADGITYTFKLNQDAKFHDGSDLTIDDVIFSIERRIDPETGGQYATGVADVVESFRAVDDQTLEVVSKGPIATFLIDFGGYVPIISKAIWENTPGADWPTDPGSTGQPTEEAVKRVIGTGPFKFVEWVQGDHVTLARNDDYWDKVTGQVPNVDEFIFRVLPDDSATVQALKTGEIDIVDIVPPASVEELQTEETTVAIYDTFSFGWYGYNLDPEKTTLFQQKEVRQALFYGLDREAIVENINLGFGEVAQGTQPVLSIAYAPDQVTTKYNYDPDKANQLLDQAGWTPGDDGIRQKDGQRLSFEILTSEGAATNEQTVAYMQEAWLELGVEAQPVFVPFPTLLDTINETHDYDIVLLGFNWDVTGSQETMFACTSYEGGFNVMKYCNEEWDRLNAEQKKTLDPAKRRELLIQLSNIANEDLPVGIISFRKDRTGHTTRLVDFYPNGFGLLWSLPFVSLGE